MKKLFLLSFPVLLFACNTKNDYESSEENIKYDTMHVGVSVYKYREITSQNISFPERNFSMKETEALEGSENVQRKGDSLLFKCDDGRTVPLVDNVSEEDDYIKFEYLGYDEESGHFIVHCSLYEGQQYVIVNKANGNLLETCGIPSVSPDKRYLVCGNTDLVAGFDFNGIQIFEKDRSGYRPAGSREFSNWGPVEMMWKNDSTLIVKGEKLKADGVSVSEFLTEWIVK